jgi:hypothetical protein
VEESAQDAHVEQVERPEDSRYYDLRTEANHADVPEHERKDGPPSPMPEEVQ